MAAATSNSDVRVLMIPVSLMPSMLTVMKPQHTVALLQTTEMAFTSKASRVRRQMRRSKGFST
jgi:hypothetical protein